MTLEKKKSHSKLPRFHSNAHKILLSPSSSLYFNPMKSINWNIFFWLHKHPIRFTHKTSLWIFLRIKLNNFKTTLQFTNFTNASYSSVTIFSLTRTHSCVCTMKCNSISQRTRRVEIVWIILKWKIHNLLYK